MEPDADLIRASQLYRKEGRTEQELQEAIALYRVAAEKNLAPAAAMLGGLYKSGIGVEKDIDMAKQFFLRALTGKGQIDTTHAYSQLSLGQILIDEGAPEEARHRLADAAQFLPDAMVLYASMLEEGSGGKADLVAAWHWYRQAVLAGGDEEGEENLARLEKEHPDLKDRAWDHTYMVTCLGSGYLVETGSCVLLFDCLQEAPLPLPSGKPVYAFFNSLFSSGSPSDIMKPFSGRDDVTVLVTDDFASRPGSEAKELKHLLKVSPDRTYHNVGPASIRVSALQAYGKGVGFLVKDGRRLFFCAGSMGFWLREADYMHMEDSIVVDMERMCQERFEPLRDMTLDAVFLPMAVELGSFTFATLELFAAMARFKNLFPTLVADYSVCPRLLRKHPEFRGILRPLRSSDQRFLLRDRKVNEEAFETFRQWYRKKETKPWPVTVPGELAVQKAPHLSF